MRVFFDYIFFKQKKVKKKIKKIINGTSPYYLHTRMFYLREIENYVK